MASNAISPTINCPNAVIRAGAQGIQRVAVDDQHAQLLVTFFNAIRLPQESYLLSPASYTLTGGARLFPHVIKAEVPSLSSPPQTSPPQPTARQVLLMLDGEGDFSIYTLTVSGPDIDPLFSSYKLRFRLGCDDRFDCRPPVPAAPAAPELPVTIDYLAKDYSSFRQALLDFIPTRLPAWTERSEADIGMMLLELLAYTADNLSYMQDRVGNEAFLDTATQRRSVAGHLELIGYQMDEGASAYTWLQFQVTTTHTLTPTELKISNQPKTQTEPLIVFEPLAETKLDPRHNAIPLYTWNQTGCCLPKAALSAALDGALGNLNSGDYLLFDDGQGHRDIVRLTSQPVIAPAPVPSSPPSSPPAEITVVSWSPATPLHFDYCTTAIVVRGNLAVATHGETIAAPDTFIAPAAGPRLRIQLSQGPLAHLDASTLALTTTAAASPTGSGGFTQVAPRGVSTLVLTVGNQDPTPWQQLPSLLDSGPNDKVYRLEIDDQGDATVVFGQGGTDIADAQFGLRPPEGTAIEAVYRVGGGSSGNVSADTLIQAHPTGLDALTWLQSVTNPLAAAGGRDLESRDHARRVAPPSFHNPLVAVTVADYELAAQQFSEPGLQSPIQRANAAFRWTGSWLTVTIGADPSATEGLTPDLRSALLAYLDTRRLAGYDLEVNGPAYLPIDLILNFCVTQGSRSAAVEQQIELALSNSVLPGGAKGFFHPDNFSFGDSLYTSRLYAAVMTVPGVESARITRLARLHSAFPDNETQTNLRQGFLSAGPDQIIRLDNDRNFPENGVLTVQSLESAQ
jgi:hypothetical protein